MTPAILAVGTYLLVWHAPRHVARLIATDPDQAALPTGRALVAWAGEARPLTLVSLLGLGLLAATAWRIPAAADGVAGAALVLIAALTFPHAGEVLESVEDGSSMVRGLHPKDAMVTTPQETAQAAPAVDLSLEDVEGSETAQLGSRPTNELHTSDRTDAPRAT